MKYPSGFYVYLLVDPRNGVPFYCGKGQRGRAWQHAAAVARGNLTGNARKVAKIQEIFRRGDEVEIQIVGEYELEDDALEHEFELVDSLIGLANVMPGGGGGPSGRRLTSVEITRRAATRAARIDNLRRISEAQINKKQKGLRDKYADFACNVAQAEEVDAWLGGPERRHGITKEGDVAIWSLPNPGHKVKSGSQMRELRSEREMFLLSTGKLVETVLPNGKVRLQSA